MRCLGASARFGGRQVEGNIKTVMIHYAMKPSKRARRLTAELAKAPDLSGLTGVGGLAAVLAKAPDFSGLTGVGGLAAVLAKAPDLSGLTGVGGLAAVLAKAPDLSGLTGVGGLAAVLAKAPDLSGLTGVGGLAAVLAKAPSFSGVVSKLAKAPDFSGFAAELAKAPSFSGVATELARGPDFSGVATELARGPDFSGLADLLGPASEERVAAAVDRLQRAEDIIADAPDPRRAVEDVADDAVIVKDAAPPEAQERVNIWVRLLAFWLAEQFFADPALEAVREKVFPLILVLLFVSTPPDAPAPPGMSTNPGFEVVSTTLTLPSGWAVEGLPAIVERAGPAAAERVVEFFTAQIRNANTRAAYAKAVTQFFTWCDERGLELDEISPVAVAAYVEELQGVYRAPTIKQHLAAIRRLFDWLVVGQVVPWNPTAAVRGPTHVVKRGKTPVLQPGEVRLLLDSIDTSAIGGLRDRALIGVMIYSFARVSAVVNMDVDDYYQQGKRWWLRLREKGGKHHALPVHHKAEAYLDAYLADAGIEGERGSPLWRSLTRTREIGERRMSRVDVFRMVKRRVKAAELGAAANCHTFRASGITAYLLNGGTLERAQAIAGHESPRTTQLYDRTADDITVEDIERIKV